MRFKCTFHYTESRRHPRGCEGGSGTSGVAGRPAASPVLVPPKHREWLETQRLFGAGGRGSGKAEPHHGKEEKGSGGLRRAR